MYDVLLQPGKSVVQKIDLFGFFPQANADALGRFAGFLNGVLSQRDEFSTTLNIDGDTIGGPAIFDDVLFNQIAMTAKTGPPFGSEQNAGLAAVSYNVLPHDVVGIAVPDGDPLPFDIEDHILFCQSVFHTPAEEESDLTSFKLVTAHDGSLGTRSRMQAETRVIMAVAVLNRDIVTNLPTDAIAIVMPGRHVADQDLIDILKEDAAPIVAIQVFIVRSITIECQAFNDKIVDLFTRDQREQCRTR